MPMNRNDDSETISAFGANEEEIEEQEEEQEEEEEEEEEEGLEEEEEEQEDDGDLSPDELRAVAKSGDDVVSRARLNEVLNQNRELMGLVSTLAKDRVNGSGAAAPAADDEKPFPLLDKIKAANKALLDGDEDTAAKIQLEIEQHRQSEATKAAVAEASRAGAAAAAQTAIEGAIASALDRYPFLNDGHPKFSKETVADMVMYRDRYMREGYSTAAAIAKAAEKVCEPILQAQPKPKQGGRADMTPAQRLRNARAATSQPPALHRAGVSTRGATDPENLDIDKLSDEEWDALPQRVKDRLKGVR